MVEKLDFVRNYDDFSSERGFQFEFYCDRCGTTFRIEIQPPLSDDGLLLNTAGSSLGSGLGTMLNVSERLHSASWKQSHAQAFQAAVAEARSEFIQCPHCRRWVCRINCWNSKKKRCKDCSPDFDVEASVQVSPPPEDMLPTITPEEKKPATNKLFTSCPNCESILPASVKFCPDCGTKIQIASHCPECGALMSQNAKVCPDCGTKRL